MPDRFGMENPVCPSCDGPLAIVEQTRHFLNAEQFDATKAGDYFCSKCPASAGQAGKSKTGHAYFWALQLQKVVEKTEIIYPLVSLCADCGPNVVTDEDGCCATCGADAKGPGVDRVHDAFADAISALVKLLDSLPGLSESQIRERVRAIRNNLVDGGRSKPADETSLFCGNASFECVADDDGQKLWRGTAGATDRDGTELDVLEMAAEHFPVGSSVVLTEPTDGAG